LVRAAVNFSVGWHTSQLKLHPENRLEDFLTDPFSSKKLIGLYRFGACFTTVASRCLRLHASIEATNRPTGQKIGEASRIKSRETAASRVHAFFRLHCFTRVHDKGRYQIVAKIARCLALCMDFAPGCQHYA
jgi:hypothetical protein